MRILITSGGTEEPIDGVRYITNFSTGKTGALLAERLTDLGAVVLLLHGKRAAIAHDGIEKDTFLSFEELDSKLQHHLESGDFDCVIHLAAVSDFSVDYIENENGDRQKPLNAGKLSSDDSMTLHLKKNYKILERLKTYNSSDRELIVIGFKLTDTDSQVEMTTAVEKILKSGKVDFVVQNNLRDITKTKHPAKIYSSDGEILFETATKDEMATKIYSILEKDIPGLVADKSAARPCNRGDAKHQDPDIVGEKDIPGLVADKSAARPCNRGDAKHQDPDIVERRT